jgi:hypothetical protein
LEELGEGVGGGEDGVGALSPAEDAVGLEEVVVGVSGEDEGGSSESVEAEVGEVGDLGIVEDQDGFGGDFGLGSELVRFEEGDFRVEE